MFGFGVDDTTQAEMQAAESVAGPEGMERSLRIFARAALRKKEFQSDTAARRSLQGAARMMRQIWVGRAMPPEVARFVEAFSSTP